MTAGDDFLIHLLVKHGHATSEQVEAIRQDLQSEEDLSSQPRRVLDVLLEWTGLETRAVTALLAEEFDMEWVDLETEAISPDVLPLVPREMATRYLIMPLRRDTRALRVAISDPLDVDGIDSLGHVLRMTIEPCLAPAEDIRRSISRHYGEREDSVAHFVEEIEQNRSPRESFPSEMDTLVEEGDAPIIRLVQKILTEAVRRRASDIHLEPLERRFRLRFRIDGVLQEVEGPPKSLQLAVISRIKIMAQMSIAEKRVPQDGRIQANIDGKAIDLRVSCLPTAHGESIVMRILDKEGLLLGLPQLGFLSDDQATFERLITLPDGILLVTGPTGSGKTTTLYACLNYINQPDRKIITVEEPVEYQLTGINQVPVRKEVNMTFANALRAMLRQAPNIIMIGEIRDLETAEIAINASLTGHMVFSTLHTNDAPGAVTRLVDIGIKPFLVATSLRAVMAQRLVRRICERCAQPHELHDHEIRALTMTAEQIRHGRFRKGAGCGECMHTGYRGRGGIFEIFTVDEEIQTLIYQQATTSRLRQRARELGMRTMREDGIRKVLAGVTTAEEVISVTVTDME